MTYDELEAVLLPPKALPAPVFEYDHHEPGLLEAGTVRLELANWWGAMQEFWARRRN